MCVNLTLKNGEVTECLDGIRYVEFNLPKEGDWSVITRNDGSQYLQQKTEEEPQGDILDMYMKLAKEQELKRRNNETVKDYRGRPYTMNSEQRQRPDEHYRGLVQPLQIMQMCMNQMELLGFLKGNVIKYSCRAGKKDGESYEKDMGKCKDYYDWVIELQETGKITL